MEGRGEGEDLAHPCMFLNQLNEGPKGEAEGTFARKNCVRCLANQYDFVC